MQTTAQAAQQATQPTAARPYLVQDEFANTGKRFAYRWPTRRRASACAKDFPSAKVTITEVFGHITHEGWVQVKGGAA